MSIQKQHDGWRLRERGRGGRRVRNVALRTELESSWASCAAIAMHLRVSARTLDITVSRMIFLCTALHEATVPEILFECRSARSKTQCKRVCVESVWYCVSSERFTAQIKFRNACQTQSSAPR